MTYFIGKASQSESYWLLVFVVMKIQRVLENNTEPITCYKSSGTDLESIVIPSENLKAQGKSSVTSFLIMR